MFEQQCRVDTICLLSGCQSCWASMIGSTAGAAMTGGTTAGPTGDGRRLVKVVQAGRQAATWTGFHSSVEYLQLLT